MILQTCCAGKYVPLAASYMLMHVNLKITSVHWLIINVLSIKATIEYMYMYEHFHVNSKNTIKWNIILRASYV